MTDLLSVLRSVIGSAAVRAGLAPAPGSGDQWGVAHGRGLTVTWGSDLTADDEIEVHWTIIGHPTETQRIRTVDDIQRFEANFTSAIEKATS